MSATLIPIDFHILQSAHSVTRRASRLLDFPVHFPSDSVIHFTNEHRIHFTNEYPSHLATEPE